MSEVLTAFGYCVAAVLLVVLIDEVRAMIVWRKIEKICTEVDAHFAAENILEAFDVRSKVAGSCDTEVKKKLALLLRQELYRHMKRSLKAIWWAKNNDDDQFPR